MEKVAKSKSGNKKSEKKGAEKPVSLAPLSFEDAIRTITKVKPEDIKRSAS